MTTPVEELKSLLHEIFQSDQADLDFGIYRILRQKRVELDAYLETQLLHDLRRSFRHWQEQTSAQLQEQLNKDINAAIDLGFDPDQSKKVQDTKKALEQVRYREGLEESVLSDLVQFLRRYYKDGDFLSLPRYRKNSYAIEYHGEEVKLHWANADQYYVKTAERFRDYRFLLPDGRAVHFKLTAANTETGNNKAENGRERRFQLAEGEFLREEAGALTILFRYEADAGGRKREEINAETARRVLQEADGFLDWRKALSQPAPTAAQPERTLLEKHLNDYTARNTFDYFIHKDLDGFLRRELDFYIKNEIVMLDDIEHESAPRVELYLAKVKALRQVGHKLIAFLAQVENFQKRLFLKKKFVVRADYCATLDRVPRRLWPEVLSNTAQLEEWRRLYALDEIGAELFNGGGELNEEFLAANQNLVIDTRHFAEEWKRELLASFDDLDEMTDGVLIKADNFHALNLLQERYRDAIKCTYIDPPYNTGNDGFMYKDGYQHSSWLSMMENRLSSTLNLINRDGAIFVSIDENESHHLKFVMDGIFGDYNHLESIVWKKSYGGGSKSKYFVNLHEHILSYAKDKESIPPLELPADEELLKYYKYRDAKYETRGPYRLQPLATNSMDDRPNLKYPIQFEGEEVWPQKQWQWSKERTERALANDELTMVRKGNDVTVSYKQYLKDEDGEERSRKPYSIIEGIYTQRGTNEIADLMKDGKAFSFPKPTKLIIYLLQAVTVENDLVLDYFAGSGTTAHAVINLNREDGGRRKYILVETNEYFDTVTLPRIKKVVYAREWKDGKPVKREGSSHLLKYFALESYEDAMNNLELRRTPEQEQALLNFSPEFGEDYRLNYMLEVETQGSPSLLNLERFAAPFDYRMKIAANGAGETRETAVDLVETFNYLIGLHVTRTEQIDGFRVVRGRTRAGERCLILWRTTQGLEPELANKRLLDFLAKQQFDLSEIDALYINGDAALPLGAVRGETDGWQLRLIEDEFLRRMFE